MTEQNSGRTPEREVVGLFSDRTSFEEAVKALLAAGYARSDLSVLSSHQSLDVASPERPAWRDALSGLVGEVKYEGPLVTAGLIALAAGSVGATIAAVLAAGIGSVAAKEVWDEITARPHTENFARALEAGSIILWVAVTNDEAEAKASALLAQLGGANIHTHQRKPL